MSEQPQPNQQPAPALDLEALKKVAKAANRAGAWAQEPIANYQGAADLVGAAIVTHSVMVAEVRGAVAINGRRCAANADLADHIATFDPPTALALIAQLEALQAPYRPSQEAGERGWLIEGWSSKTAEFSARWWAGFGAEDQEDGDGWTTDSVIAMRFARERDAQAYIEEAGWTEAKPTEHRWGPDAALQPPPGNEGEPVAPVGRDALVYSRVGRWVYDRIETLIDAKSETTEEAELRYLASIVDPVEAHGLGPWPPGTQKPQFAHPQPAISEEVIQDAARWRALLSIPRIRMQGSAGVDPKTGERTKGEYVHFGAEFWSDMGPAYDPDTDPQNAVEWGRHALTAMADAILAKLGQADA